MFNHADDSSLKWWQCFAKEMINISQSERRLRLYSSRGSRWHLPHFSRCHKEDTEHRVDELLGPDLQDLLNGETKEPQVLSATNFGR